MGKEGFLAVILMLPAVDMDLRTAKVENSWILCSAVLMAAMKIAGCGTKALPAMALGSAVPVILLWPLFRIRALGAADCKLLSALGLLLGPEAVFRCMLRTFLIGGLLANQLLYQFVSSFLPDAAGKLFDYIVIYTLGYALISWAGMLWEKEGKRERIILLVIAAAALVLSIVARGFRPFSEFKYPPQLYYISYGLLVTFGLYLLLSKIQIPASVRQSITWLSVNTMRIYMWHIFLYYLLDTVSSDLMKNPWLTYAVLLGGGVIGAWIQGKLLGLIKKR